MSKSYLRRVTACSLFAVPVMAQDVVPPPQQLTRARILETVDAALATSQTGGFVASRQRLEGSRAGCASGAPGRECRVLFSSGLGSLLLQQATVEAKDREALYTAAVREYDRMLAELPGNAEALYGKAIAYRSLGPHEWMESFFRAAPALDPPRSALYLTFQGDYYAAARRFTDAARAYRDALRVDAESDGARSGLVDALMAIGLSSSAELLRSGLDWERRYPESAANAFRAVLSLSFAPGGQRNALADSAMIGLIGLQSRNRLRLGEVPSDVSAAWTPVREIREFLEGAKSDVAPWWKENAGRTTTLAQTALASGRAAAAAQGFAKAELLLREGVRIAPRSSSVSLDLQRELALLYFRRSELDSSGAKFNALEQTIFDGKMGALMSGDLDAAQRYHTSLGLIYAARGVWTSAAPARNAAQQFAAALDKADERQRRQRFYQALPELRYMLARGLDSLGRRSAAAQQYADAAKAFLDVDDLLAADSSAKNATRLGAASAIANTNRVLALRATVANGGAGANEVCSGTSIAGLVPAGDSEFIARQRFKLHADCVKFAAANTQRRHAIAAFGWVDRSTPLVGGNDVARFERVTQTLLQPYGVATRAVHLDRAAPPGARLVQVSLPGESTPLWYSMSFDDAIASRVVSELGENARPFHLRVAAGTVILPDSARLPQSVIARLLRLENVQRVRVEPPPTIVP